MKDRFYDYTSFENERLDGILKSWDGLGGYHGLMIQKIFNLILYDLSVLDVGCGSGHLLDVMPGNGQKLGEYLGVDMDERVLARAREKHPEAKFMKADFRTLDLGRRFDVVVACGLYSGEPEEEIGIKKLLDHTGKYLIITYFAKERGLVPLILQREGWANEFILHNIDERLEIMRMWRLQ